MKMKFTGNIIFYLQIILLAFFLGFLNLPALSQEQQEHLSLDTVAFQHNLVQARWLYEYDEMAMLVNDSLKPLGKENLLELGDLGFCHLDSLHRWHIFYGNSDQNNTNLLFHFWVDTLFQLHKSDVKADNSIFLLFSKALNHCQAKMLSIQDSLKIHFNQYISDLPDHTLEVWIFPAFQPSGQALYGTEWMFHLDPDGSSILDSWQYISRLKGVWIGQPRELWLNYRDTGSPTPGSIYFAWSFKDYFTKIHIDTRNCTSTIQKNSTGQYYWNYKYKQQPAEIKSN